MKRLLLCVLGIVWAGSWLEAHGVTLEITVLGLGERETKTPRLLKSYESEEVARMGAHRWKEPLLQEGSVAAWKGVPLLKLLEPSLEGLGAEGKAQIDVVILRSGSGQEAWIPRVFLSKVPLLLSYQENGKVLEKGYQLVLPWRSQKKMIKEALPLETFALGEIVAIELSNYRMRRESFYLRRRTDPIAIQGEKLYVQNCAGCHAMPSGLKEGPWEVAAHSPLQRLKDLSGRYVEALKRYVHLQGAESDSPVASGLKEHAVSRVAP